MNLVELDLITPEMLKKKSLKQVEKIKFEIFHLKTIEIYENGEIIKKIVSKK